MGFAEINQVAAVLATSTFMAVLFTKLRQPAILGYISTGILLGPYTLQWIKNIETIRIIGDYGMLIMLFTVGLKLNIHEFKKVWKTAIACVVMQCALGALVSVLVSQLMGANAMTSVLLTCMMTLSSTAVAVKIIENNHEINTPVGSLVISILIAQDLALVPMVMVIKSFVFNQSIYGLIFKIAIAILSMAGTVIVLSKSKLHYLHKLFNSRFFRISEISALVAVSACLISSAFAEYIGLSGVYGAFLCGFILGNIGQLKNHLLAFSAPFSGILMMSFFIYIGILFDLNFIMQNIFKILPVVIAITFAKFVINVSSLSLLGWKKSQSIEASLLLSQISEFAFVLINIYGLSGSSDANFINWLVSMTVISLSAGSFFVVSVKRELDKS